MMDLTPLFESVKAASRTVAQLDTCTVNNILKAVADATIARSADILRANAKDLAQMDPENPKYDRLRLTADRLLAIAGDICSVATLEDPRGRVLSQDCRDNGMQVTRISVPFGVIGVIYEARPNVSFDVFSLCLKSGNACILKGGSDAHNSNLAIVDLIHSVLRDFRIDTHIVELLPPTHQAASELLTATGYVDLIIPRGGRALIDYVRSHATVSVIETGAGVCHTYFDASGDTARGAAIINNAKTRRVSVCNALDCLLINEHRVADLPVLCADLRKSNVVICADAPSFDALAPSYPASLLRRAMDDDFGTEFLDYKMAIKTVASLDQAVAHIDRYGSGHSESIVSQDSVASEQFVRSVDAACVYVNVSTAFTDGAQLGLGAEIGISTQKLHARGPMGLQEMTTYKWVIRGDGQIRQNR